VLAPKASYPIFANINYSIKFTRQANPVMKDILMHLILSLVNFLLKRVHKPEIYPLRTAQNEALPQPTCPKCGSSHTIKNGSIHNGKKKYKCKDCGYQ
jgi:predicted RNA-binding Zn-ribbon protein involved in translation (DUF1610 family)